jgi:hypothetical protein
MEQNIDEQLINLRKSVRFLAHRIGDISAIVGRLDGDIKRGDSESMKSERDYHIDEIERILKHE